MKTLLSEMKSVELEGDPMLQIFLFLACPKVNYSLLLDKVCLTVILVGIGEKFTEDKKVSALNTCFIVLLSITE